MPKYLIERSVPGAAKMTPSELQAIAAKSNGVIRDLGPGLQWVQTYVVADKLYCVYHARGPEILAEHARCGGFPIDAVMQIEAVIDPVTGEE